VLDPSKQSNLGQNNQRNNRTRPERRVRHTSFDEKAARPTILKAIEKAIMVEYGKNFENYRLNRTIEPHELRSAEFES